jgi:hypothetical protein
LDSEHPSALLERNPIILVVAVVLAVPVVASFVTSQ